MVRCADAKLLKVSGVERKRARLKVSGLPLFASGPDLVAAIGDIFGVGGVVLTEVFRFNASEVEVWLGPSSPALPLQIHVKHAGFHSFALVSFVRWVDERRDHTQLAPQEVDLPVDSEDPRGLAVLEGPVAGARDSSMVLVDSSTDAIGAALEEGSPVIGLVEVVDLENNLVNGGSVKEGGLVSGANGEEEVVSLMQEICPSKDLGRLLLEQILHSDSPVEEAGRGIFACGRLVTVGAEAAFEKVTRLNSARLAVGPIGDLAVVGLPVGVSDLESTGLCFQDMACAFISEEQSAENRGAVGGLRSFENSGEATESEPLCFLPEVIRSALGNS